MPMWDPRNGGRLIKTNKQIEPNSCPHTVADAGWTSGTKIAKSMKAVPLSQADAQAAATCKEHFASEERVTPGWLKAARGSPSKADAYITSFFTTTVKDPTSFTVNIRSNGEQESTLEITQVVVTENGEDGTERIISLAGEGEVQLPASLTSKNKLLVSLVGSGDTFPSKSLMKCGREVFKKCGFIGIKHNY